jgi:hypothetical protein
VSGSKNAGTRWPGSLREMDKRFAKRLMNAEVEEIRGAA